ncbi:hypothetical protein [Desulfallas thermosapovorans]|uniref:Uncharacterized protein n=1 Tax=Desulfallas thermosapovorans DSM 6562 TaxID=1121431 RepID=A0A5S4ZR03_9FIRM|nr:hypothetical protein [Desulfallas thermosapovorans]TYO95059.1 hypothetical protein LX24_01786 [Desulfallas thermosapovorans DSM 6562]
MPMAKININREQIAQYVLNNKKQVIIAGVLFLVGLMVLAALFKLNQDFIKQSQGEQLQPQTGGETTSSPEPGALSTYLPDTSRKLEDNREIRDPFSRGMMLKGIITGGSGGNLAIIESGTNAYVVGPGDEMEGGWTVEEIKSGAVILKNGVHKVQLEFNGRVKDLTPKTTPDKKTTSQSNTSQPPAYQSTTGQAETDQGETGPGSAKDTGEESRTASEPEETPPAVQASWDSDRETIARDRQTDGRGDNRSPELADKEGGEK